MARLRSTATPPMIAGRASSGSARTVPSCSTVAAVSAVAALPTPTPARRSMPTENAVAVAPPPGTTLPTAFPASCAYATTSQLLMCIAMRFSSQNSTRLPASPTSASTAQYQVSRSSDRDEEKTAARLGKSR